MLNEMRNENLIINYESSFIDKAEQNLGIDYEVDDNDNKTNVAIYNEMVRLETIDLKDKGFSDTEIESIIVRHDMSDELADKFEQAVA